jgi:hypothetical protein
MLIVKYAVLMAAVGFFMTAVLVVKFEAERVWRLSRTMGPDEWPAPRPLLWRKAARLVIVGGIMTLPVLSLMMISSPVRRAEARGSLGETLETHVLSSQPCTRAGR